MKWIVTSAWPYSSDVPHLGNLIGSVLSGDVWARYLRLGGHSVIYVSGSDEHGTPIEIEAVRRNVAVRELADKNHERIVELFRRWEISYDNYTRTESPVHKKFTQEHYLKLLQNGYVFSKEELVHFCSRDRRFLPDRFVEGMCPSCGAEGARGDQCEACGKLLDSASLIKTYCAICKGPTVLRNTMQWFFDLPKLTDQIRDYIVNNKQLSENAVNFSLAWLNEGLKPRSLTRDTSWGIAAPFPDSESKTIYVWMEAVLGYISAVIEYFERKSDREGWRNYWLAPDCKTAFFIGKDNIVFHAIILTALLLATNEPYVLPSVISSTEFLQFEGKKFSKSRRIGIWIDEALELLPTDYWRYTLLSARPESGDLSFTYHLLEEKVNVDLNDKIGNFVHRTLSAVKRYLGGVMERKPQLDSASEKALEELFEGHSRIAAYYDDLRIQMAVRETLAHAELGNRYLNTTEPWRAYASNPASAITSLYVSLRIIKALAVELSPIIPSTASKIWGYLFGDEDVPQMSWQEALQDFSYPLALREFSPLFRKIRKEDIISKLEQVRESRKLGY